MKNPTTVLIFAFALLSAKTAESQVTPPLIPMPSSLRMEEGHHVITDGEGLLYDAKVPGMESVAQWFSDRVTHLSGFRLQSARPAARNIRFTLDRRSGASDEGYSLQVTPEEIRVSAASPAGVFYGLQTLLQTLPAVRSNAPLRVPCMRVEDSPRFKWRGLHLDVSRHFFGPEVIRQYIDLMSSYKMNRFHWHLVDDQGWRIEIGRHPRLTEVGAWRVDHNDKPWPARPQAKPGEAATYGGYYTRAQVRELVEYARVRNVTIVPEIELPGHVASAIAAYPSLSCTGRPQLPLTGGDYAGIASNYCAGNDSVFTFLREVLDEVMDMFPSDYIHIGGDEVDKGPWKKCPRCQARMRSEGLKNEEELQSWFIRRVEEMVNARGRRMIGWDEILEGGLAPTATVMSWRGEAGGIEAARMGHDVVMTPGSPCYFDHYQAGPEGEPPAFGGMNTLKRVYDYEPVPAELKGDLSKHVLGAQGNVWTEHISTAEHLEYMILPRMPALSEVLWSPASARDWSDFNRRLKPHFNAFDQRGLRYSKGNFKVDIRPVPEAGKVRVHLTNEAMGSEIRYTLDGSEPTVTAMRYEGPVELDRSSTLRAVTLVDGVARSHQTSEQTFVFHKATGASLTYETPPAARYSASGPSALVDAIRGTLVVGSHWHGFEGRDLAATVDLGSATEVRRVSLGCLQRYADWIFLPDSVSVEASLDGKSFHRLGVAVNPVSRHEKTPLTRVFEVSDAPARARYLRVRAYAVPGCPKGHPGEGKPAWIFADEIVVE